LIAGSRLSSISAHDDIALDGDASHPMLGNFGAGCRFALGDVYTLAHTLNWACARRKKLCDALQVFNSIQSSHYKRLYGLVDNYAAIKSNLKQENYTIDQEIKERVRRISQASETWIYHFDISKAVAEAIDKADGMDETETLSGGP
jgi:salicylate hydroxylase